MNKKRKAIWDKSGGVCWYCGCELGEKGWHADHFEPIQRNNDGTCLNPEFDNDENMVPSCAPCNNLKSSLDIENFRYRIEQFVSSLNKYTNQYKFAKKYGQVVETNAPVVFWFESEGKS